MSEKRIDTLKQALALLKENRGNINSEARKWTEKRNAALNQIQKVRSETRSCKEKRDSLNEQVQELKSLRKQARTKRNEKQKDISRLEERIKTLVKNKPSQNMDDLQREIEEIDWKIQTTFNPPIDEKYLVARVKTLEIQLSIHKRLQKISRRIAELRIEKRSLEDEAKLHHERLSELAKQSQRLHEELIDGSKKIRTLQNEADIAHQKYLEARKRSQGIHQKCEDALTEVRYLEQALRQTEEERKAKIEFDMREKLKQISLGKLKRGEKLTWEEFQVLTEDGVI